MRAMDCPGLERSDEQIRQRIANVAYDVKEAVRG